MRLFPSKAAAAALLALGLFGCRHEGDIMESGILTSYTACPPVAVAAPAGDVTLFDPANSRDANARSIASASRQAGRLYALPARAGSACRSTLPTGPSGSLGRNSIRSGTL